MNSSPDPLWLAVLLACAAAVALALRLAALANGTAPDHVTPVDAPASRHHPDVDTRRR
ncbi:MAG: hypothetical protein MUF21_11710 [Gemmatimonadaceae bacterium]|nr:hypothetical protein [Gemmatimonadaceae bacterium]